MKKFKLFVVALIAMVLATGCAMKTEYGIKIGNDKSVKLEFLVAQDNEMIDAMLNMAGGEGEHTDKERWNYLESNGKENTDFKDFKKVKYDKNGFKGYTYTLDLGKIDDLVADSVEAVDFEKIGNGSKIFTKEGDVYKLNIKSSDDDNQQMEQYKDSVKFDVTLKVTLPEKAKSNNATKVDGTTYTWDLTKTADIDLAFELTGKAATKDNNKIIIIGAACAGAAIVIGVVALTLTKKKKAA